MSWESSLSADYAVSQGARYWETGHTPSSFELLWFKGKSGTNAFPNRLNWPEMRKICKRVMLTMHPDKRNDESDEIKTKVAAVFDFYKTLFDYFDMALLPPSMRAMFQMIDALHTRASALEASFRRGL